MFLTAIIWKKNNDHKRWTKMRPTPIYDGPFCEYITKPQTISNGTGCKQALLGTVKEKLATLFFM